ncbi:MAG TPA: membrane protein insertion efficiency factor YidD [Verrucomicrobiota bacterium]|nr:membrane protein insertion efficiency factor YidD [Verrucomicrobiota bacterium]
MNPAQHTLVLLIRLYQLPVSPVKNALFESGGSCRFTPTCSEFTLEAVRTHGTIRGVWLGLRRLARCHPWGTCGHDPVPCKSTR